MEIIIFFVIPLIVTISFWRLVEKSTEHPYAIRTKSGIKDPADWGSIGDE